MRTIVVGVLVIGISVVALLSAETRASAQEGASGSTQAPSPQNQTQNDGAASSSGAATQASPGGQAGAAGQSSTEAAQGSQGAGASRGNSQELAKSAEKGSLKSPYQDYASVAQEGHQRWMSAGCNGCHGGTGGGGMGPPLTNPVWVYGSDDDTLFRLIALGSDELKKQGYNRKGSEAVVGPMPAMGTVLKTPDEIWKVIAWIRSVNPSSVGSSVPK
jgi:mono/diheme cytochrome c family protein